MRHHHRHVLQLDCSGMPHEWISLEKAATFYATDEVAWEIGDQPLATMRGGFNVARGAQSEIAIAPIIATRGMAKVNLFDVNPGITKSKILARDRNVCAYCGGVFKSDDLECEHIIPKTRGGGFTWENIVCADRTCNSLKRDRTPEEAGMPLLYLPYRPSRWENLLLEGRVIRGDVHQFIASRLPKGSRLN